MYSIQRYCVVECSEVIHRVMGYSEVNHSEVK